MASLLHGHTKKIIIDILNKLWYGNCMLKEKFIKCIDCKKMKPTYKFNSRQSKHGIRYETRCISCRAIRKDLVSEIKLACRYGLTHDELKVIKDNAQNKC